MINSLSLVFPVWQEEQDLRLRLQDLESFFDRWPLATEIIFVVDPSKDQTISSLKSYDFKKMTVKIVENAKHLGRGPSLAIGLQRAEGDLVLIGTLGPSYPFAEYFNLIQEAVARPDTDFFFTNRFSSRKKQQGVRKKWHAVLEDIIREKNPTFLQMVQDPLSSLLAVRRSALMNFLAENHISQWYYSLDFLRWVHSQNLSYCEINVLSKVDALSRIPLLREFLRHLF